MAKGYEINVGDLAKITGATRSATVRGLVLAAEHVLGEARKIVPHEEGTLERSGTASLDEAALAAAISFDTPYAVRQHEDMSLKHDDGRTAKYLEGPLTAEAATVRELIAAEIRKGLAT
ncbi:minor capsid protein [Amycolatopsis sp. H20-H5]|uniref:minor capsid protein n=1 Tax=Amycolatopsis sp. H20-H5 TaxID=3046309 RepID=UPI002DBA87AC|nr:minor capsid protein [Amycolatopsis sp. H20-H5]MEC3977903.1 minor capsid protein [Amycolatopsis sp. H20-H5]